VKKYKIKHKKSKERNNIAKRLNALHKTVFFNTTYAKFLKKYKSALSDKNLDDFIKELEKHHEKKYSKKTEDVSRSIRGAYLKNTIDSLKHANCMVLILTFLDNLYIQFFEGGNEDTRGIIVEYFFRKEITTAKTQLICVLCKMKTILDKIKLYTGRTSLIVGKLCKFYKASTNKNKNIKLKNIENIENSGRILKITNELLNKQETCLLILNKMKDEIFKKNFLICSLKLDQHYNRESNKRSV